MSRYNRVSPGYWPLSKSWGEGVRQLGLYVQTCEHRITEGLFRLPPAYISGDLGWPLRTVTQRLHALEGRGYIRYDHDAEVVLLVDALTIQAPTTERQIKGAITRLKAVPATPLLCEFIQLATLHSNGLAEAIRMEMPNAFEWVVSNNGTVHSNPLALAQALALDSTPEG